MRIDTPDNSNGHVTREPVFVLAASSLTRFACRAVV